MESPVAGPLAAAEQDVSETKLIASLVLFIITLVCGYLPVRVILNQNYVQHAMFAGGGVLMATAFCHLIPEAHDSYKAHNLTAPHSHGHAHSHAHLGQPNTTTTTATTTTTTTDTNTTTQLNSTATLLAGSNATHEEEHEHEHGLHAAFMERINGLNVPYLEMTLCCGFFFMYLMEQLMLRFIANHSHEHPCDGAPSGGATNQLIIGQCEQQEAPPAHQHQHGGDLAPGFDLPQQQQQQPSNLLIGSASSSAGTSVGNLSTTVITPPSSGAGGLGPGAKSGATELYKFIRGLLIVSAFGTHSIFDGVAIGSQDSVERVWTIFVAISCHKLIIAAVVGLELFASTLESHLWTLVHLVIFSAMSPIGIILVVVAQDALNISSEHPSMILLQSFATGTLLYIIFVEILQPKEDQYHAKNRIGKSFSLIAGFALMLTVLTLIDH